VLRAGDGCAAGTGTRPAAGGGWCRGPPWSGHPPGPRAGRRRGAPRGPGPT
jgi:hypothetical protein